MSEKVDIQYPWKDAAAWLREEIGKSNGEQLRTLSRLMVGYITNEAIEEQFGRKMRADGFHDMQTPEILPFKVHFSRKEIFGMVTGNDDLAGRLADLVWERLEDKVTKELYVQMDAESSSRFGSSLVFRDDGIHAVLFDRENENGA